MSNIFLQHFPQSGGKKKLLLLLFMERQPSIREVYVCISIGNIDYDLLGIIINSISLWLLLISYWS